jgi:hypothetical protein
MGLTETMSHLWQIAPLVLGDIDAWRGESATKWFFVPAVVAAVLLFPAIVGPPLPLGPH